MKKILQRLNIISKEKKIPIVLRHGIGNKLNFIMNTLHLKNVEYIWVRGKECDASHDDLFCWENTNLKIYSINQSHLDKFLSFSAPEYNMKGFFWFQGLHDQRVTLAQDFLRSLRPSKKVLNKFNLQKKYKTGYAVRLLHPKSIKPDRELIFSYKSFLSSDSQKVLDANPWCYQNSCERGGADLDDSLRNFDGQICATADWFSLMNCEKIYIYGTYPTKERPLGISTFTDAFFILNKYCKNIT